MADGSEPITERPADERRVTLSPSAVRRIAELIQAEGEQGAKFRVAVSGGGCSGFQYGFSFDDTTNADDLVFEQGGVTLLVDEVSMELLAGSEIDFVEDLMGAAFQVRNPHAKSSCGCGTSFAI
jgi:iron-sulfur cluster insertion protein